MAPVGQPLAPTGQPCGKGTGTRSVLEGEVLDGHQRTHGDDGDAATDRPDPGNFATNSAAGARYGYLLVWVVVVANLMAMLVQTLTAKLGLATGRSLPELCRERLPRPVNRMMWVQADGDGPDGATRPRPLGGGVGARRCTSLHQP